MSRYEGLYTFDTDSHMYIPVGQVDDDYFTYREEDVKQPLIKDKRIRKAVRAWAEANNIKEVRYDMRQNIFKWAKFEIYFDYDFDIYDGLMAMKYYTIAELCGEEEE